jgi:hypothetical protein
MKKRHFLLVVMLMQLSSCIIEQNRNQEQGLMYSDQHRYYNLKCVLKEKGQSKDGYYFLIQTVDYPFLNAELNSYNWDGLSAYRHDNKGNILFYSKKVGDTLYFDYIKKDRFWKKMQ